MTNFEKLMLNELCNAIEKKNELELLFSIGQTDGEQVIKAHKYEESIIKAYKAYNEVNKDKLDYLNM